VASPLRAEQTFHFNKGEPNTMVKRVCGILLAISASACSGSSSPAGAANERSAREYAVAPEKATVAQAKENSRNRVSASEINLSGVSISPDVRISGRLRNASQFTVTYVALALRLEDCQQELTICETVGRGTTAIMVEVPPIEARDFSVYVYGIGTPDRTTTANLPRFRGQPRWTWAVQSIEAH